MRPNALQIRLHDIVLDRPYMQRMWGYTVAVALRHGTHEDCQLYMSPLPFLVKRDARVWTSDVARRYQGDGELIFSTPLEGLDSVSLKTYFIHDRRHLRSRGDYLGEFFRSGGIGEDVTKTIVELIEPAVGSLIKLAPGIGRFLGKVLANIPDRVLVSCEGNLKRESLQLLSSDAFDEWGRNDRADHGYFTLGWDVVRLANPDTEIQEVTLPQELLVKLDAA